MYEKGIVVKTLKEIDKEVIDEPWFGGVYAFINLLENKVYVGESKDLEERMYTHCKAIFSDKQIDSTYKASNKNLITAPQKQFCLTVFAQFDKKCEKKCEKKIPIPKKNRYWVALETVIMYLFVETGFGLYNGSGDGKIRDNQGKKRAFLLENTDIEKTRQNTVKFLNKYTLWEGMVDAENWDSFIEKAREVFIEDLKYAFDTYFSAFFESYTKTDIRIKKTRMSNTEKKWNEFVKSAEMNTRYHLINSEVNFYKFNKKYLEQLKKMFVIKNDIKKICLADLISENEFNYIIYASVGDYLGESAIKIFANKLRDLDHGTLHISEDMRTETKDGQDIKEISVCLWSLAGKQESWIREKMSKNSERKDKYVLLNYTGSKSKKEGEKIPCVVSKISLERNHKSKTYDYPKDYQPEYINSNRSNMAFLVSNIYYVEEDIRGEDISKYFTVEYESSEDGMLNKACNQKPFFLCKLEKDKKQKLIQYLKNAKTDTNMTGMVVLQIVDPYVVAVKAK